MSMLIFFCVWNPFTGSIYIIIPDPSICQHRTRSTDIIVTDPLIAEHPTGIIKIIPRSINQFPAISCISAFRVTIPPAVSTQDPLSRSLSFPRNPLTRSVYIVITDPLVRQHCAGSTNIIIPDPLICSHIPVTRIHIIP